MVDAPRAAVVTAALVESGIAGPAEPGPVHPGWIFGAVVNVTEYNSGAPAAEAEILRTQSYGRQLGQISDAVEVLIDDRARAGGEPNGALDKFVAMKAYVDQVKDNTADSRIVRLRSDLEDLKRQDRRAYDRFRAELLSAPGERDEPGGVQRLGHATPTERPTHH